MAKRKRRRTLKSIRRLIREGRGSGRFGNYKPWLYIQDVASRGLACRTKGWKTGRVHHFLSRLELFYFYLLEWSPVVIDIREQYPLLPVEETVSIAARCGIRHPVHPITRIPIVMTTDFVITVRHPIGDLDEPHTVKYTGDLSNRRTLEKLEIERRYWQARDKRLQIVTEENIPPLLARNIEWVHPYRNFRDFTGLTEFTFSLAASNVMIVVRRQNAPLTYLVMRLDRRFALAPGTSLAIARYLIANRYIHVDMLKRINPCEALRLIG